MEIENGVPHSPKGRDGKDQSYYRRHGGEFHLYFALVAALRFARAAARSAVVVGLTFVFDAVGFFMCFSYFVASAGVVHFFTWRQGVSDVIFAILAVIADLHAPSPALENALPTDAFTSSRLTFWVFGGLGSVTLLSLPTSTIPACL